MPPVESPNTKIRPSSSSINDKGHLVIGGLDTVDLAEQFGTPLWVMDETTITAAVAAYKEGLSAYPDSLVLYAGKAFLCLSMCHLLRRHGIGLDVVSGGELHTACQASFPAENIYLHGNNKSEGEIRQALIAGNVKIVVDSESELSLVASIARQLGRRARILLRLIPGVEPDTHQHIVTGHEESKFGLALTDLFPVVRKIISLDSAVELIGLHSHIGSQSHAMEPYWQMIDILADCFVDLQASFGLRLSQIDVGGGLGIAYNDNDRPTPIYEWAKGIAEHVTSSFQQRCLPLPKLLVEPGRSIAGTAGVTLYRAGHKKRLPSGLTYLFLDGGMADNPRPITYDARYTAAIANRMNAPAPLTPLSLAGRYCESGDIIIKEAFLSAESGDLIAVFGTGAYNLSMASNYNRTGRPACILLSAGKAEIIVERETVDDLLRQDRVPERLLR